MSKKNYSELARLLIEEVGGKENISLLTHCITRVRFNIKDKSKVNADTIKNASGVLGTQWQGNQFQVVVGPEVNAIYDAVCEEGGFEKLDQIDENLDIEKKKFSITTLFEVIADCVNPILPILIGIGFIKIIQILGSQFKILPASSGTYITMNFIYEAGLYFLPIYTGYTSAKRFNLDPSLGMLIGAIIIAPSFVSAVGAGTPLTLFGLPVYAQTYGNNLFPSIIGVWIASYIYRFLNAHTPRAARFFLSNGLTVLIMSVLMLTLIAPLAFYLAGFLVTIIKGAYNLLGPVGMALLLAVHPFIISTGIGKVTVLPMILTSLATVGSEPFALASNFVGNLSVGFACLIAALMAKETKTRELGFTGAISALLGGVTEPGLFGVVLPNKNVLKSLVISNICAGLVLGILGNTTTYSFFPGSLFTIVGWINPTDGNRVMVNIIIGLVVALAVDAVLQLFFNKKDQKNG